MRERISILCYANIACLDFSVGSLSVDVSGPQTIRQTHTKTHTVGLLRTSDQPIARAATYTTNTKRRTFTHSPGSEPAMAGANRLQT